jgi:hypothetical protein
MARAFLSALEFFRKESLLLFRAIELMPDIVQLRL